MPNSQAHTKPHLIQPGKKSIFGSGYSDAKKKKLESVQTPGQTRCKGCKRLKKTSQFSNKQLNDLRNYLAMGYTITDWGMLIECRQCTGVQIHEMTCAVCEETKGLDGFSKAQRHDPDNARCLVCVDEHLTADPTVGDEDDVSGDEEEDKQSTTSSGPTNPHADNDSDPEAYSHEGDRDAEDRSISEGKENARAGNSQSKWRGFASENARGTVSSTIASLNSRPNPAPKPPNSMMGQSFGGGKFAKIPAERLAPPRSLRSSIAASSKGRQVKYESDGSDDDWGVLP